MKTTDAPRQCVLIVDDVKENVLMLSGLLDGEAEFIFATDYKEALAKAADDLPDLVLLDVGMPVMDGYEIFANLKSNPITNHIPVIFVTGFIEDKDEEKGLTLGAIDYITKPFNPAIVRARVRNHLAFQKMAQDLKQANLELTRVAATDFLTGVNNRRRFLELAKGESVRLGRGGRSFGVIMVDIDKFKSINDTHGHDAGDQVLIAMAKACVEVMRDIDVVGRLGGEEFAMLLPETDLAGTQLAAERLRRELAGLIVPVDGLELSFTISAGYTIVSDPTDSIEDALKRADAALYQAKETGRNRVVSASDLPAETTAG